MADQSFLYLKQLSVRAISEFDDVKEKYHEYFKKYYEEERKRKHFECQFKQLKQVSLLAVAEYESLHKQYTNENKYRVDIEGKLKKVTEENKLLRMQNDFGATTTILPVENGSTPQVSKGELEVLRSLNNAVNDELRQTKTELAKLKGDLINEQEAHKVTRTHLNIGVSQINQLKRVSVLALDEYNDLKKKFDVEQNCRKKAEDMAAESMQRQKADFRKSRALFDAVEGEQVTKLMQEIEELTTHAEYERRENQEKIKELEEDLAAMQTTENVNKLEEKLSLVMDELEISQKQLLEANERAEKAESEARNLCAKLASAEHQLYSGVISTLPPPPPPPPPPPVAAPVIKKFITRLGRKKKTANFPEDDPPNMKAMADMIERIKQGVVLRSVNSPLKLKDSESEKGAMGELAGLLTNLRTNQREVMSSEVSSEPEFARLKLKKTPSFPQQSRSVDEETTELKKKLEKQKSVAEGLEITEVVTRDIQSSDLSETSTNGAGNEVAKAE